MNYITFGIVSFFVVMITLYSMPIEMQLLQFEGLKVLLVFALTTSALFSGFYLWPKKMQKLKYIDRIFPFGALILLPFTGSLFVIASGFYTTQLMIFIIDMVILSLLMRWKPALLISITGILLANKIAPYMFQIDSHYADHIDSIYVILLLSVFVIRFFVGPKEEKEDISEFVIKDFKERHEEDRLEMMRLENSKNEFVSKMENDSIILLNCVYEEFEELEKTSSKEIKANKKLGNFLGKLSPILRRFRDGANYFRSVIADVRGDIKLNLSEHNIKDVILEAIEEHKHHSDKNTIKFEDKIKDHKITIDKKLIKKAIRESLEYIDRVTDKIDVTITLENGIIEHNLSFTDAKMEEKAVKISFIFLRKTKKTNDLKEYAEDIKENDIFPSTNAFNIMTAHYGKIHQPDLREFTYDYLLAYYFLIPTDIHRIRPRYMDIKDPITRNLIRTAKKILQEQEMDNKYKLAKKMRTEGINDTVISRILGVDMEKI